MENHLPPPPAARASNLYLPVKLLLICILLSNMKGPEGSDCIFFLIMDIGAQEGKQGWTGFQHSPPRLCQ